MIKTEKQLIDVCDEITCPYCDDLNGKGKKMLHHSHLKQHNKKLIDVRKEFPNHITQMLSYYLKNQEILKEASKKSGQTALEEKTIRCIHCNCELIVKKNSSNNQACCKCISNGLENPDGRTKLHANESRQKTLKNKYGENVTNAAHINGIKEKKLLTNLRRYGGTGFSSDDLTTKSKQTIQDKYGEDNIMKTDHGKNFFIGNNNPMKRKDVSDKVSASLKGRPSKLFGKTYEEIMGEEKALIIKEERRNMFLQKFIKEEFPIILKGLQLEFIDDEYLGSHYKHNFKCIKCNHTFSQLWNNIQQGYLCPKCYPRNAGYSIPEKELTDYIKSIIHNEVIENSRQIIPPKELDIYIPSKQIAIEFNRLYYHSEIGPSFNDPKYHLNKTNNCLNKGIRLIHIYEDEWILKKDIVKSRLNQILGVSKAERIHARKCIIREIHSHDKNEFLLKYHIQGKDLSTIKLGAFFEDELISVMTFSKGNRAKGSKYQEGVWELNRFCSNPKYHIPGIASRLLSYFKKNIQWKEIFSYADRRWSVGDLYIQLGFKEMEGIRLNYWYIKNGKRIHRWELRKRPDEPKDITEKTLRMSEGYIPIWDCGNLKYCLKNDNI